MSSSSHKTSRVPAAALPDYGAKRFRADLPALPAGLFCAPSGVYLNLATQPADLGLQAGTPSSPLSPCVTTPLACTNRGYSSSDTSATSASLPSLCSVLSSVSSLPAPVVAQRPPRKPSPTSKARRCNHGDCRKQAVGASGLCIKHGGGRRCQHEGCTKSARSCSDLCAGHGGGRRCHTDGCPKPAYGATNHCIAHGGGKRCQRPGCPKSAQVSSAFGFPLSCCAVPISPPTIGCNKLLHWPWWWPSLHGEGLPQICEIEDRSLQLPPEKGLVGRSLNCAVLHAVCNWASMRLLPTNHCVHSAAFFRLCCTDGHVWRVPPAFFCSAACIAGLNPWLCNRVVSFMRCFGGVAFSRQELLVSRQGREIVWAVRTDHRPLIRNDMTARITITTRRDVPLLLLDCTAGHM